jgi:uncharacterized protein YjbI with pentapeptide repeats
MSMKVLPPDISDRLVEVPEMNKHIEAIVSRHDDLDHFHFKNQTFACTPLVQERLDFCDCIFEKCTFDSGLGKAFSFVDVVFKNCDLSNVSFYKSTFLRVTFVDCKAMGTGFSESIWNNVTVRNGIFRFVNFSAAKISNVLLEDSDLTSGALEQCKLKSVAFSGCNLESVEFSFTPLKGVDLSTCSIRGIKANLLDLRGAVVASHQALDLAGLLGVVIK